MSATETTVTQDKNGQFKTTVPRAFGEAWALDGEKVRWNVDATGTFTLEVVEQ